MKTLALITLTFTLTSAVGYESERATTNLAHELAECSAYYMVISTAPGLDEKTVKGLRARFEALLTLSVQLSTEKLTTARFELATKAMMRDMEGSWANISIVNNKYGYNCIDLAKDPVARMKYWLDKKD